MLRVVLMALLTTGFIGPAPPVDPGKITFIVLRDGETSKGRRAILPVPRADVLMVAPDSPLQEIGETDAHGRITLDKSLVAKDRGAVLLFCAAGCECAAIRTDGVGIEQYDELTVAVTGIILQ